MWNTFESVVNWHYEYEEGELGYDSSDSDDQYETANENELEQSPNFYPDLASREFVVDSMRSLLFSENSLDSDDEDDMGDLEDTEGSKSSLNYHNTASLSQYGHSIATGLVSFVGKLSNEILGHHIDHSLTGERIDPLQVLPDECIVHILSYMGAADVGRLGLCSTQWNVLCRDEFVWRDLVRTDFLKGQKEGLLPLSNMKLEVSCKICPEQVTPYLGNCADESYDDSDDDELVDDKKKLFSVVQRSEWQDVYALLKECRDVFNTRGGSLGIQQFNDRGFVDTESHQDVAKLLMVVDGLDRDCVAQVVQRDTNTMSAFMDLFDFEGISLVNSLHMVLSIMKLPDNSQTVSQFLEALAQSYSHSNPNTFEPEQAVVLLYSFLMMGATLHAQQQNNQLSLELMNNNGFDLSEEFLNTILADFGVAWPRNLIAADAPIEDQPILQQQ